MIKLRVLYDHQTFYQKIGGVSRYFTGMFPFLEKLGSKINLSCYFSNNIYLENRKVKKFFPFFDSHKKNQLMQSINEYFSMKIIKKGNYDVFHPTQYQTYFINKIEKPYVVTIHDMVSEIYDIDPVNTKNKKVIIQKANKIIAISENTKMDILKYFPEINPEKITVIHHGYYQKTYNTISNKYGNYILFVGMRSGYKNFNKFLDAIIPMLQNDLSLNLVCTGKPFNDSELEKMKSANILTRCHSAHFSDRELFSLYKFAKVFVFPSLYEGFGFPILEAFSNNCPVCISNASCFPEIAGDAALYFDPSSVSSIRESVKKLIYSPKLSNKFREKGKVRVKEFSLEKSAKLHYDLYKSIC